MTEINIEQSTPQINIDTATRTYHLPIASETQLGGIKVGNNLTIEEDGTLNAESTEYNLPVATSSTLGGVKIGSGLSMSDQVLSVTVDSVLNNTSVNPVRNSVVTSYITTLSSGLQTATTNISDLTDLYTTLNSTVGGHTMDIQGINDAIYQNTLDIQTNADNISNNTLAIQTTDGNVSDLGDRVTTAEDNIVDLQSNLSTLAETQSTLATVTDSDITYSYLLPVSTWSAGAISFSTRGLIVNAYFNLTGSLTLNSNASTLIYTLGENFPTVPAYGVLLSDDGSLLVDINTSGEITLTNISSHNINLTKLQGCLSYTLSFSE